MKKILTTFLLLVITAWVTPQAQAAMSTSKSFKLSVTIPESVTQKTNDQPAMALFNTAATPIQTSEKSFLLIESVRDNQKVIFITYVVE